MNTFTESNTKKNWFKRRESRTEVKVWTYEPGIDLMLWRSDNINEAVFLSGIKWGLHQNVIDTIWETLWKFDVEKLINLGISNISIYKEIVFGRTGMPISARKQWDRILLSYPHSQDEIPNIIRLICHEIWHFIEDDNTVDTSWPNQEYLWEGSWWSTCNLGYMREYSRYSKWEDIATTVEAIGVDDNWNKHDTVLQKKVELVTPFFK